MADTSLKAVTHRVRHHIEESKRTTHQAVTAAVIADYRQSSPGDLPENTLRRRIYDVITVLRVIGYVQKVDDILIWIGDVRCDDSPPRPVVGQTTCRVQSKEQFLQCKMRLLLLYNALIETNRTVPKPANAISFPVIIASGRGPPWIIRSGPSAKKLTIESQVLPELVSPVDILLCKPFSENAVESARRCLPSGPLVAALLPR
jgi:hypothetical protein